MRVIFNLVKISSFLILCSVAIASQHSFYTGVSVGFNSLTGKTSSQVNNIVNTRIFLHNNKKLQTNSSIGGIYAMYLFRYCNFGLATEAAFNYSNLEKTLNAKYDDTNNGDVLDFVIKQRTKGSAELSLKPGYFVNEYFTYAILGVGYQNMFFNYTATGATGGVDNNVFKGKSRKIVRGAIFGLGIHKDLYEHIAVGFEFKTARYAHRKYNFDVARTNNITLDSTFKKISSNSYCLRVMYKF